MLDVKKILVEAQVAGVNGVLIFVCFGGAL